MTLAEAITIFLSSMKGIKAPATIKVVSGQVEITQKFFGSKNPDKKYHSSSSSKLERNSFRSKNSL